MTGILPLFQQCCLLTIRFVSSHQLRMSWAQIMQMKWWVKITKICIGLVQNLASF